MKKYKKVIEIYLTNNHRYYFSSLYNSRIFGKWISTWKKVHIFFFTISYSNTITALYFYWVLLFYQFHSIFCNLPTTYFRNFISQNVYFKRFLKLDISILKKHAQNWIANTTSKYFFLQWYYFFYFNIQWKNPLFYFTKRIF